MSSNIAALWDKIEHELGWNDPNMQRDRPYNGQAHTDRGERGKQLVEGLTMRDIRDCFLRAYILAHPYYKPGSIEPLQPNATLIDEAGKGVNAALCDNDVYSLIGHQDAMAIGNILTCEIEKLMGIFPNLPEPLKQKGTTK